MTLKEATDIFLYAIESATSDNGCAEDLSKVMSYAVEIRRCIFGIFDCIHLALRQKNIDNDERIVQMSQNKKTVVSILSDLIKNCKEIITSKVRRKSDSEWQELFTSNVKTYVYVADLRAKVLSKQNEFDQALKELREANKSVSSLGKKLDLPKKYDSPIESKNDTEKIIF
ncbi:MAG: hypothetical protein MHPSP_003639, partial [Paramarteilia canceri]